MEGKSILLVEDNASDVNLTRRALAKKHVPNELTVARDGQEALDYLLGTGIYAERDISKQPSLIMLDLKLPKIDGLTVLKKIRTEQSTRLIPVVILTSSDEEGDLKAAYSLGANSYIRKPLDFNQFAEAISYIAMYWLTLNETPLTGCQSAR